MTSMAEHPAVAAGILNSALTDGRAGELLDCLFAGGSAAVDADGHLVLIDAGSLAALVADADGGPA